GIYLRDFFEELFVTLLDVRAVFLDGGQAFFFRVMPRRASARQTADVLAVNASPACFMVLPARFTASDVSSASVRSGFSPTISASSLCPVSSNARDWPPPCGRGSRPPVSRRSAFHL